MWFQICTSSTYSYISTDNLHLSEHDRRILESMALKKKIERESDEFAYQAHQLWEQDREEREQVYNYFNIKHLHLAYRKTLPSAEINC